MFKLLPHFSLCVFRAHEAGVQLGSFQGGFKVLELEGFLRASVPTPSYHKWRVDSQRTYVPQKDTSVEIVSFSFYF